MPGRAPHPRRDPRGHSYGEPEPSPPALAPERWRESEDYLYGVDLYNFAYWWECHEVFEALWRAAGRSSEPGRFFQALVLLAAAQLKAFAGADVAAQRLARRALARLEAIPGHRMGIDVPDLAGRARAHFEGGAATAPLIRLEIG